MLAVFVKLPVIMESWKVSVESSDQIAGFCTFKRDQIDCNHTVCHVELFRFIAYSIAKSVFSIYRFAIEGACKASGNECLHP